MILRLDLRNNSVNTIFVSDEKVKLAPARPILSKDCFYYVVYDAELQSSRIRWCGLKTTGDR